MKKPLAVSIVSFVLLVMLFPAAAQKDVRQGATGSSHIMRKGQQARTREREESTSVKRRGEWGTVKERRQRETGPTKFQRTATPDTSQRKKPAATADRRPAGTRPLPETVVTDRERLAQAWKAYREQRFHRAVQLFRVTAQGKDSPMRLEALLGLGYSLQQTKDYREAQAVFDELVQKEYQLEGTLPALMELLFVSRKWKRAEALLQRFPSEERETWQSRLQAWRFYEEFEKARDSRDRERLLSLLTHHRPSLQDCRYRDGFFSTAVELSKSGEKLAAEEVARQLLRCNPKDWKFRILVLTELASMLPLEEAEAEVQREQERAGLPAHYVERLTELKVQRYKQRLVEIEPASPEYRELAGRLLLLQPDDEDIRRVLAWSCYRAGEYHCALDQFSTLTATAPKEEYLLGHAYALEKVGEEEQALALLQNWGQPASAEIIDVKLRLYTNLGLARYNEKKYLEAESYLARALSLDREDRAVRTLLAWTRFNRGDLQGAESMFRETYETDKSREAAENLLAVLEKSREDKKITDFLSALAREDEPSLGRVAQDYYCSRQNPVSAAQAYRGPDSCCADCDKPRLELLAYYRFRDGDSGFSELNEFAFPLIFHYPVRNRREWKFGITTKYLDADSAPNNPAAGSFYRFVDDPNAEKNSLLESEWVWFPWVGYRLEGPVDYELLLGATPLNGPVDPMVTFLAQAWRKDAWRANIHQCAVEESILSYIGQRDPYRDREWGRVLKTGFEADTTFSLAPPFWLSLQFGFDYYWGEEVKENYSLSGTVSAGRTDPFRGGSLSYGLFATSKHFDRDTSAFTFGHGGYFSPDIFFMVGPFFDYETSSCGDYWFDARVSLGYLYYEEEDARRYYKTDDDSATLSPAARQDFNAKNNGDTESDLGIALKLQALKPITDRLALGAGVSLDNTSNFTEWQALLTLRWYFAPRKGLCATRDLFGEVHPCL